MRFTPPALLLAAICFLAPVGVARAQDVESDSPRHPSVLNQLFPNPTGQNGFEDVALAIDALRDAKAAYPPEREFTLEKKRSYLSDPACQKALFYLRAGLAKTVVRCPIPEPTTEALYDVALSPMAGVRSLARLLAVEQYVLLADGRTREAIVSAEYALRLAQAIKGGTLTSSLVASAVNSITLERLARHGEQWSLRDCDRILALARTYHSLPDPGLQTIEWERRLAIQISSVIRRDAAAISAIESDEDGTKEDPILKPDAAEIERLGKSPEARAAFASEVSSHLNAAYDQMARRLRDPTLLGQNDKATGVGGGGHATLAARFAAHMSAGASDTFVVSLVTDRVRLQLLGVHAAIRKYRWENGRLPERLEDLDLKGGLATDPFSGKPLLYKKTGDTDYELSSIGGPAGQVPITLPRTPIPPPP